MNTFKMGQGTWKLGDNPEIFDKEVESIRMGIENGLGLIDTAEMYGDGNSEILVGEAIKPYNREDLFIVSKVYPHNAGSNIYNSVENSFINYRGDMIPIPRTSNPKHNIENAKMLKFELPLEDYRKLDNEFPAPDYKTPLHIV